MRVFECGNFLADGFRDLLPKQIKRGEKSGNLGKIDDKSQEPIAERGENDIDKNRNKQNRAQKQNNCRKLHRP